MNRSDIKNLFKIHSFEFKEFANCLVAWKFPVNYQDYLDLLDEVTAYVKSSGDKVFICCSHPTVATFGRGDRQNAHLNLESKVPTDIPRFDIKRGGGMTLHHEQQWIFYPIVKLDADHWTLTRHMCWMIGIVKVILAKWDLKVIGLRNPLGVWFEQKKIASIGIGVNRFVSNHGLALNINSNQLDKEIFKAMNPCGLNASVYSSVNEILNTIYKVEDFNNEFLKLIDQMGEQDLLLLAPTPDCHFD